VKVRRSCCQMRQAVMAPTWRSLIGAVRDRLSTSADSGETREMVILSGRPSPSCGYSLIERIRTPPAIAAWTARAHKEQKRNIRAWMR